MEKRGGRGPGAGGGAFPALGPCPPAPTVPPRPLARSTAGGLGALCWQKSFRFFLFSSFFFFFKENANSSNFLLLSNSQRSSPPPRPGTRAPRGGGQPGPLAPELFTGPTDRPSLFQLPESVSIIKLF